MENLRKMFGPVGKLKRNQKPTGNKIQRALTSYSKRTLVTRQLQEACAKIQANVEIFQLLNEINFLQENYPVYETTHSESGVRHFNHVIRISDIASDDSIGQFDCGIKYSPKIIRSARYRHLVKASHFGRVGCKHSTRHEWL